MALLIDRIKGKVVVNSYEAGKRWHFKGENCLIWLYFSEDPGAVEQTSPARESAQTLKGLLHKVRAVWGESPEDRDDLAHDRRTSQILDNRRGGIEIGLPYNNQDPREHNQIKNFITLLLNLSGLMNDEWIKANYPGYADSLRNIRKVLGWTYGMGTGAFLRCELIAGKKRLGVPLELYHDSSVEPYYAARDGKGRIIGRGIGHGV